MATIFTAELEANAEYRLGEVVTLSFQLTNITDDEYHVLMRHTPLEGIRRDYIIVTKDGSRIPYDGILEKRGDPFLEEYLLIAAGGSAYASLELSAAYSLSEPGEYQVQVETIIHDHVMGEAQTPFQARPTHIHEQLPLLSNLVNFRLVAGGGPRLTLGEAHRSENPPSRISTPDTVQDNLTSLIGIPAKAPIFNGGTDQQRSETTAAHNWAIETTWAVDIDLRAVKTPNLPRYINWFGADAGGRITTVTDNLKAIWKFMSNSQVTYDFNGPYCSPSTYAYTYKRSSTIFICGMF